MRTRGSGYRVLACDDESCESDCDEVFHDRSRVGVHAGDRCETRSVTCVRADYCPGDAGIAPNVPEPLCIVAIIHPTNAPLTTRAERPMACVREGVFGSTSTTYSPTAATARTIPQMPPRTSITAATGVKVRRQSRGPEPVREPSR